MITDEVEDDPAIAVAARRAVEESLTIWWVGDVKGLVADGGEEVSGVRDGVAEAEDGGVAAGGWARAGQQ